MDRPMVAGTRWAKVYGNWGAAIEPLHHLRHRSLDSGPRIYESPAGHQDHTDEILGKQDCDYRTVPSSATSFTERG